MVLQRRILSAIKKSLISGRALMTCLRATKLASIVGPTRERNFTINMRSESPVKYRNVLECALKRGTARMVNGRPSA